jgi:hypothetical protein
MPKDASFDISLSMHATPEGERYRVDVTFDISDDGRPFANTALVWHDVPEQGVDYMTHIFEQMTGHTLQLTVVGVSEKDMLKLEKNAIGLLKTLNELGHRGEGKTREEKQKMISQLVHAVGATGRHRDHNV